MSDAEWHRTINSMHKEHEVTDKKLKEALARIAELEAAINHTVDELGKATPESYGLAILGAVVSLGYAMNDKQNG